MPARLLYITYTFLRIVLGGVVSPQPLIQYVNHLSPEINKHQRESPHRHVDGSPLTPIELEDSRRWQVMEADGGPGARRKRPLSFHSGSLSDGVLSLCSAPVTTVGTYQAGPVTDHRLH